MDESIPQWLDDMAGRFSELHCVVCGGTFLAEPSMVAARLLVHHWESLAVMCPNCDYSHEQAFTRHDVDYLGFIERGMLMQLVCCAVRRKGDIDSNAPAWFRSMGL